VFEGSANLLANAFDGSNPSPTTRLISLILLTYFVFSPFYPSE